MEIKRAKRNLSKIKILLLGTAGSGKTYSSLKLAYGMTGDYSKVCVIDAEKGSSNLYSHLGDFGVLQIEDYSPETYINAILHCVKNNIEFIIIDGISPEWLFILEYVNELTQNSSSKNSFFAWGKATPRHNKFIEAILKAPVHIICTARVKTNFVVENINGKAVPKKFGLEPIIREQTDYEFSTVIDIFQNHKATSTKDRTELFLNKEITINEDTGKMILNWINAGEVINNEIEDKTEYEKLIDPKFIFKQLKKEINEAVDNISLTNLGMKIPNNSFTELELIELRGLYKTRQTFIDKNKK